MGYPKQLIENLEKKLDERLIEFYETNKELYEFGLLNNIIEETLNLYLNGDTHRDDLQEITSTQRKIYRNKKARWLNTVIEDNKKYKIIDKKNPFYFLSEQKGVLLKEQWEMIYGKKSMEDIINEFIEKIKEWKADKKSLLIDYPIFTTLTPNNKTKAFYQDVFLDVMRIIKNTMNGSIEEFYKPTPSFIINVPLFSYTSFKLIMTKNERGLYEYNFYDEKRDARLTLISGSGDIKMLDEVDLTIMNTMINYIGKDFYQSRKVHLTIGTLAQAIYRKKNPGAYHYKIVKERLDNMTHFQFEYYISEKKIGTYNFLDHIEEDLENVYRKTDKIHIMLGSLLYESIVQNKMIYVTSDNYNALSNPLSKILYYVLQKERIKLSAERDDNFEILGVYDYSFFSKSIMFREKKKTKNIQLLKESLEEFVEKQIAVKTFNINKDTFRIMFTPLSASERADLINEDTLTENEYMIVG